MSDYCKCKKPDPSDQYGKDESGVLHFYCERCNKEIEPEDEKTLRLLKEDNTELRALLKKWFDAFFSGNVAEKMINDLHAETAILLTKDKK